MKKKKKTFASIRAWQQWLENFVPDDSYTLRAIRDAINTPEDYHDPESKLQISLDRLAELSIVNLS